MKIQLVRRRLYSVYSRIQYLFYPLGKNLYALFVVLGLLFLTGCASIGTITQSTTIEPHSIKTIGFRVTEADSDALSGIEARQIDMVSREISRRFAAVGYPVTVYARVNPSSGPVDDLSKNSRQVYSHILEASVGSIEQDNTPRGFSFALGDSDPRSKQFQKAKVVEVTCTLRDLADPESAVTLVEQKSADSISDTAKDHAQLAQQFYVETIGSTCHNLLTKLDVYPQDLGNVNSRELTGQPLRMETDFKTETIPANRQQKSNRRLNDRGRDQPVESGAQDEKTVPGETYPSPQRGQNRLDADQATEEQAVVGNSKNSNKPARVSDKPKQTDSWRDKQTRIFNQGDTVILEFGYKRR